MNTNDLKDAIVGIGSTGGGVAISYIEAFSPYVRFASLCIGCVIGLIVISKHNRHWK
jgi:hypothetical protein